MDGGSVAILLLIAALILHLAEEVKTGFRKKLPVGEMPLPVFVGINVVIYVFCFATLALSLRNSRWAVPLAWVFAVSMALNRLGHRYHAHQKGVLSRRPDGLPIASVTCIFTSRSSYGRSLSRMIRTRSSKWVAQAHMA